MALSTLPALSSATPTGRRSARGGLRSCRNFEAEIMLIRGAEQRQTVLGPRFGANKAVGRSLRCRARSKLRREEVGGGLLRRWASLGPCRWQAAHPLQLVRLAIYRRRTPHRYSSLKRKSRTSAWRLSMSSTRKTLQHIVPAYSLLPEGADTEAAEAAQPTQAAEAAQSTQAAEAAQCTEAAAAAQLEAAAAAAAAAEAAAYGLDPSGSASSSSSLRSRAKAAGELHIRDVTGQGLFLFRGRAAAKLLTKDEARRIAANIAKLPELLRRAQPP